MIYVYDDTFDGMLTAVFDIFELRDSAAEIVPASSEVGPTIFERRTVSTDEAKSERVQKGLYKLDSRLPKRIYTAWLSHADGVEDLILAVCRLGFKYKADPFRLRQYDAVVRLDGWVYKVGLDAQRMRQFVRFIKLGDELYVADIEPEYDVLSLIGNHFHARYSDCRFVIRDVRRRRAIVSDPSGWHLADVAGEIRELRSDGEYEKMWRSYFDIIAIEQRINPALQQKFVPKKVRRYMTEFESD